MTDKQKKEFVERYSFDSGSLKWIPKGGELMNYIGSEVMYVEFTKQPDGKWANKFFPAIITAIGDYDPITLTYQIDWIVVNGDKKENKTERITPEGWSLDILGQGTQDTMNRFVPYSLHSRVVEEESRYHYYAQLWEERNCLGHKFLQNIAHSAEQHKMLTYAINLQAIVKGWEDPEAEELVYRNEVMAFRIRKLSYKHVKGKTWRLSLYDWDNNLTTVEMEEDAEYAEIPGIGDLKVIDLASNDSNTAEE